MTSKRTAAAVSLSSLGMAAILAAITPLHAQHSRIDGNLPAFDVASVKTNAGIGAYALRQYPNGVDIQGATAAELIAWAFDVVERDLLGGPDWIRARRFDVSAKTDANPVTVFILREMMRTLLAERFGLTVGHTKVERPVYALRFAREDRRRGPNLKASQSICAWSAPIAASGIYERQTTLKPEPGDVRCGIATATNGAPTSNGRIIGLMSGLRVTMGQLADALSRNLDRPVIDETGLIGEFDFTVRAVPALLAQAQESAAGPPDSSRFFVAFEDQLGLTLRPSRGPAPVVEIIRIQPPTGD